MKKKDNFFLNLHNRLMKDGRLKSGGLCVTIVAESSGADYLRYEKVLKMCSPTPKNMSELIKAGKDSTYWASDMGIWRKNSTMEHKTQVAHNYGPLRQNILLLCHYLLNS